MLKFRRVRGEEQLFEKMKYLTTWEGSELVEEIKEAIKEQINDQAVVNNHIGAEARVG